MYKPSKYRHLSTRTDWNKSQRPEFPGWQRSSWRCVGYDGVAASGGPHPCVWPWFEFFTTALWVNWTCVGLAQSPTIFWFLNRRRMNSDEIKAKSNLLKKEECTTQMTYQPTKPPASGSPWHWCCCCCHVIPGSFLVLICLGIGYVVEHFASLERARVLGTTAADWPQVTDQVCGMTATDPLAEGGLQFLWSTYETAGDAWRARARIGHCGACGECSNGRDIEILYATRNTLTGRATQCALLWFMGGMQAVRDCFDQHVRFTPDCRCVIFVYGGLGIVCRWMDVKNRP